MVIKTVTPTNPACVADLKNVEIDISVSCAAWSTALATAEDLCRDSVLAALQTSAKNLSKAEVSIVLANDEFIQGLNKQYRHIDRPTNVLAFPGDDICPDQHHDDDHTAAPVMLGDVVVAYETAVSEAHKENKSLADHLSHLVVHGTLHLLGHDHENDEEAVTMETLEVEVLSTLGVQNPYDETSG
jgi:probable rRNA maturation factor